MTRTSNLPPASRPDFTTPFIRLLMAGLLVMAAGFGDANAQGIGATPAQRQAGTAAQPLRRGFNQPPDGETRFLPNEVILDIAANVPTQALDAIAARHTMTRIETISFRLTGRTLHRWRLDGGGSVTAMIRGLNGERQVAGAQPNYLYELMQNTLTPGDGDQYAA